MKILVVDDEDFVRNMLIDFISAKSDHKLFDCNNGSAALDILQREKIDLVLSDIMMPQMDGHELLLHIKKSEKLKDIEVILLTGYGTIKSAVQAMKNGAYNYLMKPFDLDELQVTIKNVENYISLKNQQKILTKKIDAKVRETKEIKDELNELKRTYAREIGTEEIGVFSDTLRDVFWKAKRLHDNRKIPVLIEGETGTGKEIVARYIHYGDGSVVTPFIDVNCAAISSTLFESELFGYEAGAFTGSNPKGQKGKFDAAKGGTIFLDEITEMLHEHQAKLLRVIQEREFYRVGGLEKHSTDARIICATNKDVNKEVREGSFRQDLYYRLNVGYVKIPPLRDRSREIMPLAIMFLQKYAKEQKVKFSKINKEAAAMLKNYHWPGNIRELKSIMQRITLLWDDDEVTPDHIEFLFQNASMPGSHPEKISEYSLDNILLPEKRMDFNTLILDIVKKSLDKHHGNKTDTALYLGISRHVLYTHLKRLEKIKNLSDTAVN